MASEMLSHVGRFINLTIDQYAIRDTWGEIVGGITVGINPATPHSVVLMNFHIEGDMSALAIIHELCRLYPSVTSWKAFQAKLDKYIEKRVRRPRAITPEVG